MSTGLKSACLAVSLVLTASSPDAFADDVADFYGGKTITIYVASGPGGGYAIYGQIAARHLGRHIPGNPAVVPSYMPGGGGITAANYLFNAARQDGTALGVLFAQTQLAQFLHPKNVKYDAVKYNWIGIFADIIQAFHVSKKAKAPTLDAMKTTEIVAGSSGDGSGTYLFPKLMNDTLGTKIKIVSGYAGTNALNLAMERGEIDGFSTPWGSVEGSLSRLRETANQVVQYGVEKHPSYPGVPLLTDLASDPKQKATLRFVAGPSALGRSLTAPPGVPEARVAALRKAFIAMLADPEFVADAKKGRIDMNPTPGERAQALVRELADVDPAVLALAKEVFPR
jgi:tripartite-type tricarboxylate transporter receptor subunit TctC